MYVTTNPQRQALMYHVRGPELKTSEIQIFASTQAALEQVCETLEAEYGERIELRRARTAQGEWEAWGTLDHPPRITPLPAQRKQKHQRIIIS
jgi:hypothetical protein